MLTERAERPVGFRAMDRSLKAVLIGTFTLRFSTGLTGAMLATYLAHFGEHHPETGPISAITVGLLAATFYVAELVLSPIFGVLSDRLGIVSGPLAWIVPLLAAAIDAPLHPGGQWLPETVSWFYRKLGARHYLPRWGLSIYVAYRKS